MRKNKRDLIHGDCRVMVIDDDQGILDAVCAMLGRGGYECHGFIDPLEGLDALQKDNYDLLILDYLMSPICGDEVVRRIRLTNTTLHILLLTGHSDLAPPMETFRRMDIQAYCEKSDRLDQLQILVEASVKSIRQMRRIGAYRDGLSAVLEAVPDIFTLQSPDMLYEDILYRLTHLSGCEDCFVFIAENGAQERLIGTGAFAAKTTRNLPGELNAAIRLSMVSGKPTPYQDGLLLPFAPMGEEFASGVLYASPAERFDPDILALYARQVRLAVQNAAMLHVLDEKNAALEEANQLLRARYMDTVEALRLAVDARDKYTRGHSDRVAFYATSLGKAIGLDSKALEDLRIAGIFHDIGKIGTADDILLKAERLTLQEYEEVKKHPAVGANILYAIAMFKPLVPIVRHHHERVDGTGYPDGIRGDAIELHARIIALADAFDAMTSDRHYRRHLTMEQTLEQLELGRGTQFDAALTDAFLALLERDDLYNEAQIRTGASPGRNKIICL